MASTVQDILDSETPRPTWALRPSLAAPIRSDMTFERPDVDNPDPTARTLDPRSGLYEARGADVPRIWGSQQGLLVETRQRTNHVPYSSAFDPASTTWSEQSGITSVGTLTSIIKGETARTFEQTANFSNGVLNNSGLTTSSSEVLWGLFYEGTADTFRFGIRQPNGTNIAGAKYTWSTDTLQDGNFVSASQEDKYHRLFSGEGPNGEDVVQIILRYNHGVGENRQITFGPDVALNGDTTTIAHAQIEENPVPSSVIVTDASASTRGAESINFPRPDTFGFNGFTWTATVTPLFHFLGGDFGQINVVGDWPNFSYFRLRSGSPFFRVDVLNDGFTQARVLSQIVPYEPSKMGVSVEPGVVKLAVNGAVDKNTSANTSLIETLPDPVKIANAKGGLFVLHELTLMPGTLPTTEADRSAGDPVSLETLTS